MTPYAQAVFASKPIAYWRLQEMNGPAARDAVSQTPARFEDRIAFYLEGPDRLGMAVDGASLRAAHFAGGRLITPLPALGNDYTAELWFWNGLPTDFRDVTGYLVAQATADGKAALGDCWGIGGKNAAEGRLIFSCGSNSQPLLTGHTSLAPRTWHHVVLVRDGKKATVYLDGNRQPEIVGESAAPAAPGGSILIGGRGDSAANFEGKLCEAAIYDRALTADEAAAHYQAAGDGVRG